jgi:hypothetical protein
MYVAGIQFQPPDFKVPSPTLPPLHSTHTLHNYISNSRSSLSLSLSIVDKGTFTLVFEASKLRTWKRGLHTAGLALRGRVN